LTRRRPVGFSKRSMLCGVSTLDIGGIHIWGGDDDKLLLGKP